MKSKDCGELNDFHKKRNEQGIKAVKKMLKNPLSVSEAKAQNKRFKENIRKSREKNKDEFLNSRFHRIKQRKKAVLKENNDITKGEKIVYLKFKKGLTAKETDYIRKQFLKACVQLDASIFEPLINEDIYFKDLYKNRFLDSLKEKFYWTKKRGAKELNIQKGVCTICTRGEKVYEFINREKKVEFAYNIRISDANMGEIFLCNLSTGRRGVKTLEEWDKEVHNSIKTIL